MLKNQKIPKSQKIRSDVKKSADAKRHYWKIAGRAIKEYVCNLTTNPAHTNKVPNRAWTFAWEGRCGKKTTPESVLLTPVGITSVRRDRHRVSKVQR